MSILKIITCDFCNCDQNFPNPQKIEDQVLEAVFGIPEEGSHFVVDQYQQRGAAILAENSEELPPGWREDDSVGHECNYCGAERRLDDQRAVEGDDESHIGEMPQVIEQVLENHQKSAADEDSIKG